MSLTQFTTVTFWLKKCKFVKKNVDGGHASTKIRVFILNLSLHFDTGCLNKEFFDYPDMFVKILH